MSLEEALTAVEQHIEQVSGALLSLDAPALEAASTALRDAAARFTWVLEQSKGISAAQLPPQFEQRLAAKAPINPVLVSPCTSTRSAGCFFRSRPRS